MIGEITFVADTSALIDHLRALHKEDTPYDRLVQHEECGAIVVEVVAELYSGKMANTKSGKENIEKLLAGLRIFTPDVEFMKRVGELRRQYQLSVVDACVAQLALDLNLPLATLDQAAFKRIKTLLLLPWHDV